VSVLEPANHTGLHTVHSSSTLPPSSSCSSGSDNRRRRQCDGGEFKLDMAAVVAEVSGSRSQGGTASGE
jgi:hypothetical protein